MAPQNQDDEGQIYDSGTFLPMGAVGLQAPGLISESGRFPGGGRGNPLQYSCLENPIDRAWGGVGSWEGKASVRGSTKNWT